MMSVHPSSLTIEYIIKNAVLLGIAFYIMLKLRKSLQVTLGVQEKIKRTTIRLGLGALLFIFQR